MRDDGQDDGGDDDDQDGGQDDDDGQDDDENLCSHRTRLSQTVSSTFQIFVHTLSSLSHCRHTRLPILSKFAKPTLAST